MPFELGTKKMIKYFIINQANNSSRDSTLEVTDNGTPVTQDEEAPAAVEAGADVDVESLDDDQLFQHLKVNYLDLWNVKNLRQCPVTVNLPE